MILQALTQYYRRRSDELAPEGWIHKELDFVIVLNPDGEAVQVKDLREQREKKLEGKVHLLPSIGKQAQKHTNSGTDANLLWDNAQFLFGVGKKGKISTESFLETLEAYFPASVESDAGVEAVKTFFRKIADTHAANVVLEKLPRKDGETLPVIIAFQLLGDDRLVSDRDAVKVRLSSTDSNASNSEDGICLVTGEEADIAALHTVIKGVWGGQASGGSIISFNKEAFKSYAGKQEGKSSAPVGASAMFEYTTALNALLGKDSRQRMQIGDSSTVFWSEEATQLEEICSLFFSEPPKDNPHRGIDAVKALFDSPHTGAWLELEGKTRFHVLGLAPNAARISIRFWITDTVANMAGYIRRHFEDAAIVHAPHENDHLSLFRLLAQTAVQGKAENIPNHLAGETARSIFTGTRYPATLLSALIRRIKAEGTVPYPRAAFIKACVNRMTHPHSQEKELAVSLDTNNTNRGYLLGRLFAVLERAQEQANGEASIASRYYGAASSAPSTVFGTLLRLSRHHLAKIEYHGSRVKLEQLFGEIMAGLADFSSILSLADQGRFAIGYYHQRQDFFTKKEEK